jgi:hypothetical protein
VTERYRLGETIPLGGAGGRPAPAACRFEVSRPDGATLNRDWDKKAFRIKASQPGIWSWRMYVREGNATSVETGEFEVLNERWHAAGVASLLTRLLRRFTGERQR